MYVLYVQVEITEQGYELVVEYEPDIVPVEGEPLTKKVCTRLLS